jgi:hypothetical protein
MVIMDIKFYFCFRPEDISPKCTIFVPMCSLGCVWSKGFLLCLVAFQVMTILDLFCCGYRYFCTWDIFALFTPKYIHL